MTSNKTITKNLLKNRTCQNCYTNKWAASDCSNKLGPETTTCENWKDWPIYYIKPIYAEIGNAQDRQKYEQPERNNEKST